MELEIKNNLANYHFEAIIADKIAFIDYKLKQDALVVFHTEVPQELEGQGIATALTKHVLEYAAAENLGVVPLCPFHADLLRQASGIPAFG